MTQLDRLNLSQTRVDDLTPIAHLTRLTNLDLSLTPIDDNGLAPIAGLAGLNVLDLRGTSVTAQSATISSNFRSSTLSRSQKRGSMTPAPSIVVSDGPPWRASDPLK